MSKKNACCQAEITQPIGILVSLSLSLSLSMIKNSCHPNLCSVSTWALVEFKLKMRKGTAVQVY